MTIRTIAWTMVLAVGLGVQAEPVVTDVLVRQMWPWERRIQVTFTLKGVEVGHDVHFALRAAQGETDLGEISAEALSGDVWGEYGSPARKTIWIDPAQAPVLPTGATVENLRIAVTAVDVGRILYKVVDLEKAVGAPGQVTYVTESDLRANLYGTFVENPITGVSSLAWTQPATDYATYAGTKLLLRRIRGAAFKMGANLSSDVTLSSYWISVFPITYKQLALVTGSAVGSTPYVSDGHRNYFAIRGESVEVDGKSCVWPQSGHAVTDESLVGQFRSKTGLVALDLPTDAQWEYACRAGTDTTYFYNSNEATVLAEYAVYSGAQFTRVGLKKPNAWGLYDMLGGNWEWTLDWYADALPTGTDPVGATAGTLRVKRGGAAASGAANCTSFKRLSDANCTPGGTSQFNSFRLVENAF